MKTRIGTEATKEEEAYAPVHPQQPPQTVITVPQQVEQPNHGGATCWYVFGILATICCCLPCGVIGMVHAMIAKHEGERGNLPAHRRRMRQAKCWTSWSIGLGVLVLVLLIIYAIVAASYYYGDAYELDDDMMEKNKGGNMGDDWSQNSDDHDMNKPGADGEDHPPFGRDRPRH